jgi:predicted permease
MQDIRYALRTLRKQPVFTFVAVATLALGIGANTAIFSLLYQILLQPLPYPQANRLVFVWNTYPGINLPQASVSIPDYIDRAQQAPAIESATLFTMRTANLNEQGTPEQLRALAVTPSFFPTLQRWPVIGRGFTEDEAKPGNDRFVVLTWALWTSHYASDRSIIGRDIRVNGEPYRVVGVLPANLDLPSRDVALIVPFSFTPDQMSDNGRGNEFSSMIARLKPGATIEQANGQFKAIVSRNLERLPQFASFAKTSGFGGYAIDMRDQLVGDVRTSLYVLQAGVLFVLLIACANVANLLLMRATARHRELAIRGALGAGRMRIVRQLLTEGLVLSLAGAIAGIGLGVAGVKALLTLTTLSMTVSTEATLNAPVLLFALALAVATGLVFGSVPVSTVLRTNTAAFLKDDSARGTASKRTGVTRSLLVVAETAVAVMLLIGSGLLIKSFLKIQEVNPGFSTRNVLTAQVALPATRYATAAARLGFWNQLVDRVRAVPGVSSVGLTTNVPFNGSVSSGSYSIVGRTLAPGEAAPHGRQEVIAGDYFNAMEIPLIKGRTFVSTDVASAQQVCIIDAYLVKKYFSDRDPIGEKISRGGPTQYTIVGVAGTINSIDLGQPVTKERIYYPESQIDRPMMALVVKTGLDPMTIVPQVRAAVKAIDAEQPLAAVRTMDQWVARSLESRSAPTMLLTVFGGVALLLSAIGIYGVLAFGVAQRAREFGIRNALGADRGSILSLVIREGLRTAAIGVALGVAAAFGLTRFLQTMLFGVTLHDPAIFGGVCVLLLAVAAAACYVPARRATTVDPMVALRAE